MKRLRERIRAVTDKLKPSEWLTNTAIRARLRGEKPTVNVVGLMTKDMVSRGELERERAPKGTGRGVLHMYRSGRNPIGDEREGRGRPRNKLKTGFMALARLERENPEEWKRLTQGGAV